MGETRYGEGERSLDVACSLSLLKKDKAAARTFFLPPYPKKFKTIASVVSVVVNRQDSSVRIHNVHLRSDKKSVRKFLGEFATLVTWEVFILIWNFVG